MKSKEEVDKSSRAHLKAHQTPRSRILLRLPLSLSLSLSFARSLFLSRHLIDMRLITEIRRRERCFSRMFMRVLDRSLWEMWISINRSLWKPVAGGSPLLHRALIIRFYSSRLPTPVSRRLRPSRPRCWLFSFLFVPFLYNPNSTMS